MVVMLLVSACGVKGPPVSPVRPDEIQPERVVVDCSVYDPNCPEEDPKYIAGLDPKDPKDAALIKKLEAARKKRLAAEKAKKKAKAPSKPAGN